MILGPLHVVIHVILIATISGTIIIILICTGKELQVRYFA